MATEHADDKNFTGAVTFEGSVSFTPGTGDAAVGLGDGTGAPTITLDKAAADVAAFVLKSEGAKRASITLTADEELVIEIFNGTEVSQGSISIATSGAVTLTDGVAVGGLIHAPGLAEYADNAAAVAGGLVAGNLYTTSGAVKIVTA